MLTLSHTSSLKSIQKAFLKAVEDSGGRAALGPGGVTNFQMLCDRDTDTYGETKSKRRNQLRNKWNRCWKKLSTTKYRQLLYDCEILLGPLVTGKQKDLSLSNE